MQEIIPAVKRELIISELTEERFLRHTSKGGNQLYLVNYNNAPNTVREVGRLREVTFRAAGGGTGKALDLDNFDVNGTVYDQLITWDPEDQEIMAGYRLLKCTEAERGEDGNIETATTHLFKLSEKFVEEYLEHTLELGRSFVQPAYQSRNGSNKGLYSLDNLWDGLGAVVKLNPDLRYLFGKVTMYPDYQREARNMLMSFMNFYFPDRENLVYPHHPVISRNDWEKYDSMWEGLLYKEGHIILNKEIRARGENIPPLINSYMNLSPSMKTFGTALNTEFGEVEETGILVKINDIFEEKRSRYIDSFEDNNSFTGAV